jgi:hypothetical protein
MPSGSRKYSQYKKKIETIIKIYQNMQVTGIHEGGAARPASFAALA